MPRSTRYRFPERPADFQWLENGIALKETLHTIDPTILKSGSEVTDRQYALFRAYFPRIMKPKIEFKDFLKNELKLENAKALAVMILSGCKAYANMLQVVGAGLKDVDNLDHHSIDSPYHWIPFLQFLQDIAITKFQKNKLEDPSHDRKRALSPSRNAQGSVASKRQRPSMTQSESSGQAAGAIPNTIPQMTVNAQEYPICADESIVNADCLLLLKALASMIKDNPSKWALMRLDFEVRFDDKRSFKAMTDGVLYARDAMVAQAIVEVKPEIRGKILKKLQMQEAAEIVAWFKNSDEHLLPDLNGYRFALSLQRHQAHLLFARPVGDYRGYINGTSKGGYLCIQVCGPWDITDKESLKKLCELLLAIMIQGARAAGLNVF